MTATAERLAELCARPLDTDRWPIVMLDGLHLGEHLLVVALGVTADGTKVPLGVVEGSTENAAVCTRLVTDLADRGLDPSRGITAPRVCLARVSSLPETGWGTSSPPGAQGR